MTIKSDEAQNLFLSRLAKAVEAAQQWERFRKLVLPSFGIKWYEPEESAFKRLLAISEEYYQLKAKEDK